MVGICWIGYCGIYFIGCDYSMKTDLTHNSRQMLESKNKLELKLIKMGIKIIGKYLDNSTPILIKDVNGYFYYMCPTSINRAIDKNGNFNRVRFRKSNPYTMLNIIRYVELNFNHIISMSYEFDGSVKPMLWFNTKCGHFFERSLNNFMKNPSCPICSGRQVLQGFNDISTLRPDLTKYFLNKNDVFKNGIGSGVKIKTKCPECGNVGNEITIDKLVKRGFSCSYCGDGFSLPNKILANVLEELQSSCGIDDYELEYGVESIKSRYDGFFKIGCKEYVVEAHGIQHYKQTNIFTPIEKQRQIDLKKYEYAKLTFEDIVVVDCSKSQDYSFIKNNYIESFKNIIDIRNLDWNKIFLNSSSSRLIKACKIMKESNNKILPSEVSKILKISTNTAIKYLKIGNEIGICKYTKEK